MQITQLDGRVLILLRNVGALFLIRALQRPFYGTAVRVMLAVNPSRSRKQAIVCVIVCVAIHGGMLAYGAARHSPGWDEWGHLVAGLSHWELGRFDLYRVNPPLVRVVGSLPVWLLTDVKMNWKSYDARPGFRSERDVRDDFIRDNGARVFCFFPIARWACIPFSLLGAILCFRWASDLHSREAGVIAATLWCFSPTVLAFGQTITPDVAAAAMGVTAAYTFWKWLQRPSPTASIVAGGALGLAQLTKSTWAVLFVLWPVLWIVWRVAGRKSQERFVWPGQALSLFLVSCIGLWILNAGYRFEDSFRKLCQYEFVSEALSGLPQGPQDKLQTSNRFSASWLGQIPVPLPANYVQGIDLQKWDFERTISSYLRGEWRQGGWWYYYFYALAIKEPIGTWLLALLACATTVANSRRRRRSRVIYIPSSEKRGPALGHAATWRDDVVLLTPAVVVIVLVSSQTGFNHHLRYVLPAFPFLFIWISKVAREWTTGSRKLKWLGMSLLCWSIVSSASVYPHSMSYFNEFVDGPKGGHWHLGNSNTDWGQDLLYLKEWYEARQEARPLHVAYDVSFVGPEIVGIRSTRVPPGPLIHRMSSRNEGSASFVLSAHQGLGPAPGWYAISVNQIHNPNRHYEYFLEFEPMDWIGYSMPVYHITLDDANRVRRKLGLPELTE